MKKVEEAQKKKKKILVEVIKIDISQTIGLSHRQQDRFHSLEIQCQAYFLGW